MFICQSMSVSSQNSPLGSYFTENESQCLQCGPQGPMWSNTHPLFVSYFFELISSVFTLWEIIPLGSLQWILPQGFGTSCSFCLECISLRLYTAHSLTLFRSLLKYNFLSKNLELPQILTFSFPFFILFFIVLTMVSYTYILFIYLLFISLIKKKTSWGQGILSILFAAISPTFGEVLSMQ